MTINREGYYDDGQVRECTNCGKMFKKVSATVALCNYCNSERVKNSFSPEWKMHQRAKCRAKLKDKEFDIEIEDINIPEYCPILGIRLEVHSGKSGAYKNSPSLDRIDNSKGYTKNNIQVISQQANAMKANASKEELLSFALWILETYNEN